MKIKSIKRNVERVETFDIEVGGKDGTHSYMMKNGCVSHNSTNGIEAPRSLMTIKDGVKFVVPEIEKYFGLYETMWNIPNNKGYLDVVAIMQKFMDQSISTNTHYDPFKFPDEKIPAKVIMDDLLYAYKMGVKTLYYHLTNDVTVDEDDIDCDSCKI